MSSHFQYPISNIPFTQVTINDKFWSPRIETNRSVTVPYDPGFCVRKLVDPEQHIEVDYCGASLPAMVKLGREKGYRLVGANRYGFNVIFLRDDWQYGRVQHLLRAEPWDEI